MQIQPQIHQDCAPQLPQQSKEKPCENQAIQSYINKSNSAQKNKLTDYLFQNSFADAQLWVKPHCIFADLRLSLKWVLHPSTDAESYVVHFCQLISMRNSCKMPSLPEHLVHAAGCIQLYLLIVLLIKEWKKKSLKIIYIFKVSP